MNMLSEDVILFEHRFWLQIMGDHARFIFLSLAPSETEYLITAQKFIITLDELLNQSLSHITSDSLSELNQNAITSINKFREFKLELLRMSISSDLKSHLPPSFYNDMLNELDEYLLVLKTIMRGQIPLFHPLHYHVLWLTDSIGHAATIASTLDMVEKDIIAKAYNYEMEFSDLFFKSYIMRGYLRTQQKQFPALDRLNNDVNRIITDFMAFLERLRDQRMDQKILGTLMPLMADHMYREACYYLWKLSQTSDAIRKPECDPTRPRINI